MNFLEQCTALITGASSGLGAEFARQLAPQAKSLILVARREDRLEALKAEIARPGLTIYIRRADLSERGEVESLIEWLKSEAFPINFLVNNAGVGDHGLFEESDPERLRQMIQVNIMSLTQITHALVPTLKAQRNPAILNVSSIASLTPIPMLAVYAATKAYVTSFSEAIRAELRHTGIRVTALCPGPVETEFGTIAQRPGELDPMPSPEFFRVPAVQVVADALHAVEKDRPRIIPGLLVAIVMCITAAMPLFILRLAMNCQTKRK